MIDRKKSAVIIHLLKGPLYKEMNDQLWENLKHKKSAIIDYTSQIGLNLHINEEDGYAFLKQQEEEEASESEELNQEPLPRLVSRRSFSFLTSVLFLLLRKKLIEHESQDGNPKLIIKREEIHIMLQIYMKNEKNEKQARDTMDRAIEKAKAAGILRSLRIEGDLLEVKKIIKSLISPEGLKELDDTLTSYKERKSPLNDEAQ